MILRQLFDRDTCTYTYLLADKTTREAIIIDSVLEQVARARLDVSWGLEIQYKLNMFLNRG